VPEPEPVLAAPVPDPEPEPVVPDPEPEVDPLADFVRREAPFLRSEAPPDPTPAPAEELPEAFPPSEPVPLRSQRADESEPEAEPEPRPEPEDPLTSFLSEAVATPETVTPAEIATEDDEAGDGETTRSSSG
jgi:hypothetical protein